MMSKKPSEYEQSQSRADQARADDADAKAKAAKDDPSKPQPAQPESEKTQAEKDADREPLAKEQAEQLLRNGHRLRRKGDDPANWVAMTRHGSDLGITVAATQEAIDHFLSEDLILAE
jgi:hypothetical protein